MSVRDLLEARRAERDAILERATALLVADTRIVAAWLTGSLGRGDGDSLSDIDLRVIVEDAEIGAFVANRRGEVGQIGQPILIEEAPQNAPPGGAYLLVLYGGGTGAHQVDWYWQPQVSARFPPDARMLFDRAGIPSRAPSAPLTDVERTALLANKAAFQWAMLPIAAKKIARADSRPKIRRQQWGRVES